MDSMDKLRQKIREHAPLPERLGDSAKMIGKMCSEGRPPKMSIPCNWLDEDIYITTALKDAIDILRGDEHRQKVLNEINAERDRQEAKWGRQDHQPERWLSILGEEFGEVCKAVCEASFPGYETSGDWSQYRTELIHVAAVAAAMAECFDRREEARNIARSSVLNTAFAKDHSPDAIDIHNKKVVAEAREINKDYAAKAALTAGYLSSVVWANKSPELLEAVRKAYIEAHRELPWP